jgi:hypothetical protein
MKSDAIKLQTDQLLDDVLYTEKALFWLATQWRRMHYMLGIPSCISSALAGVFLVKHYDPGIAMVLMILSTVLTALLTFLDPKTTYKACHEIGVKYGALRNEIERFRNITLDGKFDEKNAVSTLADLSSRKFELQKSAPHTGGMAYRFAKWSIGRSEHLADAKV